MKKRILLVGMLAISLSVVCQPMNRTFQYYDRQIILLGPTTVDRLAEEPFNEWYSQNYEEYEVDNSEMGKALPDSVTIFMGTWCGDSKREVPRFIKILKSYNFDMSKLSIINVNSGFQQYKQAPERQERGMDIHRVPTFIFHDADGSEIGRIVEEPIESLELDMQKILYGEEYRTYYPVANDLIEKFKTMPVDQLRKQMKQLVSDYQKITVSEYELNTYGYVLWSSFQIEKAEFVFELNYQLYPDAVGAISSIARYKSSIGKQKQAKKYLNKGLVLEPDSDMLLDIKKNLERAML